MDIAKLVADHVLSILSNGTPSDQAAALRRIKRELREVADRVSALESDLVVPWECHCPDCGRDFDVHMSSFQERGGGLPDDCPACFEKRTGRKSARTVTYR